MQLATSADQKCYFLPQLINKVHFWALCRQRNKERKGESKNGEGRKRMSELSYMGYLGVRCVCLSSCLSFVDSSPP